MAKSADLKHMVHTSKWFFFFYLSMKSTKLCNYLLCVAVVFRNVLSQAFPGQIHVFRCLTTSVSPSSILNTSTFLLKMFLNGKPPTPFLSVYFPVSVSLSHSLSVSPLPSLFPPLPFFLSSLPPLLGIFFCSLESWTERKLYSIECMLSGHVIAHTTLPS